MDLNSELNEVVEVIMSTSAGCGPCSNPSCSSAGLSACGSCSSSH